MRKDDLNVHVFQNKNLWLMIFFLLWLSEDLSIERILIENKYGGTGLISEKTKALYIGLNERAEAATSSYSVTSDFWQYVYSVPVTENQNPLKVFSSWVFDHILIMVTVQL